MKSPIRPNKGSVLVITLMTLTIMTMICATSLYIVSQNTNGGMQTAGWQQAMPGAESGIDAAIRALNAFSVPAPSASPSDAWSKPGWIRLTGSTLPTTEASATAMPTASASVPPASGYVNYLPSSQLQLGSSPGTEGSSKVTSWVTVDTAGMSATSAGQWYRVRAVGQTKYPSNAALLRWSSMNRLDNELRNTIALKFSRAYGGNNVTSETQGATRTIEVILAPLSHTGFGAGMYLLNKLTVNAGNNWDYFNSNITPTATFLSSPSIYRGTDYTTVLLGLANANGSSFNNKTVYGEVAYSTTGSAPSGTTNVKGGLVSPFNSSAPTTSDPSWTPDVTYAEGSAAISTITVTPGTGNGSAASPYKVKITGGLKFNTASTLNINYPTGGTGTVYVEIWVAPSGSNNGSLTMLAGGQMNIAPNVHVTTYVDGSVTLNAGGVTNGSGLAANNNIVVVGSGAVSCNAGTLFCGTIMAPNSDFSLTGGIFVGAIVANTMTYLGGTFHYDSALATTSGSTTTGNFAFASWFEDNSDIKRLDSNMNRIIY